MILNRGKMNIAEPTIYSQKTIAFRGYEAAELLRTVADYINRHPDWTEGTLQRDNYNNDLVFVLSCGVTSHE